MATSTTIAVNQSPISPMRKTSGMKKILTTVQVRSILWMVVFFGILALITVPFIFLSHAYKWEINPTTQALIVIVASALCQLFIKRPFTELTGTVNYHWVKHFLYGTGIGAALMLLPALFLYLSGWVSWETSSLEIYPLLSTVSLFVAVAVAEELLFHGFIFQRLIEGFGKWAAQLVMAGYFLLIHMNNPGLTGNIKWFASINIFIAAIMFGLAFIKTRSLAMPIGLHFMANWVQGTLLGFGVSGNEETSLLKPIFNNAPEWMTGGNFGLEASVPGLLFVILCIMLLHRWKPRTGNLKFYNVTSLKIS